MYVGCYTIRSATGILVYSLNLETGIAKEIQRITELVHASFLVIDSQNCRLYAVSEQVSAEPSVSGEVYSFDIEETGKLRLINKQQTVGQAPCHLSLNHNKDRLVVVNYLSGTVVLYPIDDIGAIGSPLDVIQLTGSSINPDRQASPHPHAVCFQANDDILFIPDLGQDKIISYRLNDDCLSFMNEINICEGAGPRHFSIHPDCPYAYLINELDSSITIFNLNRNDGQLTTLQTIPCIPENYSGGNMAAEINIHPNGKFLYCSNRGHDSLSIFHINRDGTLIMVNSINTMIKTPRHFNITSDGSFLIVANQDADNLVRFKIDQETGELTDPELLAQAAEPVCINFLLKA
jgi:6-phosphogluconolactonase